MCKIMHISKSSGTNPMQETWKALADPTRRGILDLLRAEPRTTSDICAAFEGQSRFKVMNHMAVLRDAGLLRSEKRGRERINSLDAAPLGTAYEDWMRHYEVEWAGRLGRLQRFVETRKSDMEAKAVPTVTLTALSLDQSVEIEASCDIVFRALTDDIGAWFHAYRQIGEDATDIVIEARPGGHFKEWGQNGDGAIWGTVQEIKRNALLVLEGRMGMRPALHARTVFALAPHGDTGCRLTFTQRGVGEFTAEHHEKFGEGWRIMLCEGLKCFFEYGVSVGPRR